MTLSPHLKLYSRVNCKLCEAAWDELSALAAELEFSIERVDIGTDPMLMDRLRNLVPVVDVTGGPLVYPPITTDKVLEAIAAGRSGSSGRLQNDV